MALWCWWTMIRTRSRWTASCGTFRWELPASDFQLFTVYYVRSSVADPGCLSRIRFFFHPGSRIRLFSIPDPNQKFSILTKKLFLSSRRYHLGSRSGSWFFTHPGSRVQDPGVRKTPDPGSGSATLVRSRDLFFYNSGRPSANVSFQAGYHR